MSERYVGRHRRVVVSWWAQLSAILAITLTLLFAEMS